MEVDEGHGEAAQDDGGGAEVEAGPALGAQGGVDTT